MLSDFCFNLQSEMHKQVIIIGAGPSGLVCGIEAQKKGLDYVIIEKGFLVNSIYNFPSNMTFFSTSKLMEIGDTPFIAHNDKPTRREALEYYRRIAESWDLNIHYQEEVLEYGLSRTASAYTLKTNKKQYTCDYLIVSTGYYDNYNALKVPGEHLTKVKHYYDDAHRYIGQKILVIGAANSACDVALETLQKGADVSMVIRSKELYKNVKYWIRPNIENRIKEGSIKAYFESNVKEIKKDKVIIRTPKGEISIDNDIVLAMTGYRPDFKFLESLGIQFQGENQVPIYEEENFESNLKNVYLAGVILAGNQTSKLFIENTRHHGHLIIGDILKKIHA